MFFFIFMIIPFRMFALSFPDTDSIGGKMRKRYMPETATSPNDKVKTDFAQMMTPSVTVNRDTSLTEGGFSKSG